MSPTKSKRETRFRRRDFYKVHAESSMVPHRTEASGNHGRGAGAGGWYASCICSVQGMRKTCGPAEANPHLEPEETRGGHSLREGRAAIRTPGGQVDRGN